ncbi:tetratricopeptide repeat protein, partial [Brevundimonas sp.]|uniref:tetratricopeptide repeat protein n=1 Tax=Brevundimonas sp. TaxID=1871086 RepID=UPI0025C324FC
IRESDPQAAAEALVALGIERYGADDVPGAGAALKAAVEVVETRLGPAAKALVHPLAVQARLKLEVGDYPGALADLERALSLMDEASDPLERATLIYDRARTLDALGRNEEAEAAARESLAIRRAQLGEVHEKTADSLNLVANALTAQGRHAEADPLYRQVLGMYEVLYGPDDFHVAIVLSNLGNSLRRTGRAHQAEPLYVRAVTIAEGANDPVLLAQCLTNYGWFLHVAGDGARAEAPFRRALALALEIVGPDHPFTGNARANIGYALSDQGRWTEAEEPFRQGLAIFEAGVGADSPDLLDTLTGYAAVLDRLGRGEEAEALYRRARTIAGARLPPAHATALAGTEQYAGFLIHRVRSDEALVLVRGGLGDLLGQQARGRDWRTRVRGARPLFARQVEAAWTLAAATD